MSSDTVTVPTRIEDYPVSRHARRGGLQAVQRRIGLMMLAPIAIAIGASVILYGGPENAMKAVDGLVRTVVYRAMDLFNALI